jgi:uncharacterized phage protein gp47/JayE
MPDYIAPPLVTEPGDLADQAFSYLEDQVDGWLPSPGNLETWVLESGSQLAAELMDVASAVPTAIFRYFGSTILNLPALEAVPATGTTTWTVSDALGYTILAGTLVGIPAAGDTLLGFEVAVDTPIPPGATTATGVVIVAQDAGTEANDLSGDAQLIDALDWVTDVTLTAPTSGGIDGETDDAYLNRLRELLQLLAPRPILPNDFAVIAKQVAGVFRATAIDLYNASTNTSGVPRCVTVVVAGADGLPVSAQIKADVDALLQSQREVNFLVFVIDPTYLTVAVTFTIKPYPDYGATDVVARARQAVTDYLSPATFGNVPYGEAPQWLTDPYVRYLEVAEAINRVEGVWYIGTLTINGGTVDLALPVPGGLPKPGAINGTPIP